MSEQRYVTFERGDIAAGQAQLVIGFKTPDGERQMLRGDVPLLFARRLFGEALIRFEASVGNVPESTVAAVDKFQEMEAFDGQAESFDINVDKSKLSTSGYKYEHTSYLFKFFCASRAEIRARLTAVVDERAQLEAAILDAGIAAGVHSGKESLDTAALVQLVQRLAVQAAEAKVANAESAASVSQKVEDLLGGPSEWTPLTGPGQIKPGYELRFQFRNEARIERARLVKYAGTPEEEVIYDIRQNHYFIVGMALAGNSHAKSIEYRRPNNKG